MKQYVYADIDHIVFEGRHREYGAFQMRQKYNRLLTRATLIAFLLFISVTALPKLVHWIAPAGPEDPNPQKEVVTTVVNMEDLPDREQPEQPEEMEIVVPPEPAKPPVETVRFVVPDPVPDEQVTDEQAIVENAELDRAAIGLETTEGDAFDGQAYDFDAIGEGDGDYDVLNVVEDEQREIPADSFIILEKQPAPVNMDELRELIGYPEMAKQAELEGKVTLRVYIDKLGNYVKHKVVNVAPPLLIHAVEKHIHKLKMTPGIQAGRPLRVWVTVPFNFRLTK